MERFCKTYWAPVLAFVEGSGAPNPQDTTQEFFALLVDGGLEALVPRVEGRFRNYLRAAIRIFMFNEHRTRCVQKRGGKIVHERLHPEKIPSDDPGPEEAFNHAWGQLMLEQAKAWLAQGAIGEDEARRHATLEPFIDRAPESGEYAQVATQLGISVELVRTRVKRLRDNYSHAVRVVVGRTVDTQDDIDGEMDELADALGV